MKLFVTPDFVPGALDPVIKHFSELLNIKTEFLTGDITAHERITIPISNGKNVVLQDGDTGSWIGIQETE